MWLLHPLPADFSYDTLPAAGLASLLHTVTAAISITLTPMVEPHHQCSATASRHSHKYSLQSHRIAMNVL